jgi:AraC-like DNA-binding protein
MNYRACIQASIDYIEEHLKEELTAEGLASIAGFSVYHYSRVFHAYVGKPVMEYIRCRRLAYGCHPECRVVRPLTSERIACCYITCSEKAL